MVERRWVKLGVGYLAASAAFPGVWALAAPRSFFDSFPGGPMGPWVASQPPYNEHLVRDVGAFYVGFAVLFLWALLRPAAGLVRAAAVAGLVATVPHLLFHLAHDEGLSRGDWVLQGGALASVVVVAALIAWRARGAH